MGYRSVCGTWLDNGQIPCQYTSAESSYDTKYVLMGGGGNDCWMEDDDTMVDHCVAQWPLSRDR